MASIVDADLTARDVATPRLVPRRAIAMFLHLRRQWRRRVAEAQLRRELGDARLLADVGLSPSPDVGQIVALAHAMGGAAGTKV